MTPKKLIHTGKNPRIPAGETEFRHYLPLQLRFNDIDMLGHVNNSVYVTFFDMGKTRYFEAAFGKVDFSHISLVVVNVNCDLMEPTYFDDDVELYTRVEKIGNRSLTMEQRIVDRATGHLKARCMTVLAGFNTQTATGAPLDPDYIAAIEKFEGRTLRNIV